MKIRNGLGKSNDRPRAVQDEIRAARLALGDVWPTSSDGGGYQAHFDGFDVRRGGWAGWLDREISTHDEQREAEVAAMIADVAPSPSPLKWQAKVHAACDVIDEQTRHDVAASVARHDALQADPHADFTARFQADHADEEPTQVGAVVDDRFDGSEP